MSDEQHESFSFPDLPPKSIMTCTPLFCDLNQFDWSVANPQSMDLLNQFVRVSIQ